MNVASALLVLAALGVSGWHQVDRQPARHTVYYENGDDRYGYNTYDATAQPPTITGRVQNAVTETGTTLRDGIEAGLHAAGQKLDQAGTGLKERSSSVGRGISEQLKDLTSGTGRQLEYTGDNLRNVAGQTVGAAGDALTATGDAIGIDNLPPLRKLDESSVPPLPAWSDSTPPAANATVARSSAPATTAVSPFAGAPTSNPPPAATTTAADGRHPTSSATPGSSWNTGLSTSPTSPTTSRTPASNLTPIENVPTSSPDAVAWDTAGSGGQTAVSGSRGTARSTTTSGMVPVPTAASSPQSQPANSSWSNPWPATDPWNQPASQSPNQPQQPSQPATSSASASSTTTTTSAAPWPSMPSTPVTGPSLDGWGDQPADPSPSNNRPSNVWPDSVPATAASTPQQPAGQPQSPAATPLMTSAASAPTSSTPAAAPSTTPPAEQQPWVPLVLVSLGLAGSLGANLYLGWSYIEARHRYQVLAQKTADTFQRARDLAA